VTGQFGKNHLGDRDEHLPTAHGFDEFFGNLYHLNAEEEPENPDYPKNPESASPSSCGGTRPACTSGPTSGPALRTRPASASIPTAWWSTTATSVKAGLVVGGTSYKVHLDGYDWGPYLRGQAKEPPRKEFLYWSDDGDLVGLRYEHWKAVFMEQRAEGFEVWSEPMVRLRVPKILSLRADPFERAQHEGMGYKRWWQVMAKLSEGSRWLLTGEGPRRAGALAEAARET
jgi:arylsulfatase A-like enzyme